MTIWASQRPLWPHHDDKMDLAPARQLDAMEAVETREERVRVALDVGVIGREERAQEAVLGVTDRLDDELEISRVVEEGARLARRAELRKDILCRERQQVVGRINVKVVLRARESARQTML
jgi:hypothetical protein